MHLFFGNNPQLTNWRALFGILVNQGLNVVQDFVLCNSPRLIPWTGDQCSFHSLCFAKRNLPTDPSGRGMYQGLF